MRRVLWRMLLSLSVFIGRLAIKLYEPESYVVPGYVRFDGEEFEIKRIDVRSGPAAV